MFEEKRYAETRKNLLADKNIDYNIDIFTFGNHERAAETQHHHEHYEIVYVLENESVLYINDDRYLLNDSHIALIPPHVFHRSESVPMIKQTVYSLKFREDLFKYKEIFGINALSCFISKYPVIKINDAQKEEVAGLFQKMLLYNEPKNDIYVKAKFLLYLCNLLTSCAEIQPALPPLSVKNTTMAEIVKYIKKNYSEDINLDMLAQRFNVKKYEISRFFKYYAENTTQKEISWNPAVEYMFCGGASGHEQAIISNSSDYFPKTRDSFSGGGNWRFGFFEQKNFGGFTEYTKYIDENGIFDWYESSVWEGGDDLLHKGRMILRKSGNIICIVAVEKRMAVEYKFPCDGVVTVGSEKSKPYIEAAAGSSVCIAVYKGKEKIWPSGAAHKIIHSRKPHKFEPITNIPVKAGESVYFVVFERKENNMSKYLNRVRINHAKEMLSDTGWKITDIAAKTGFNNITHFNYTFRKEAGYSPKEYRFKHRADPKKQTNRNK